MKIFISWSGKRSKALALALKDWLPLILQYAKPWVSEKDISAGERWALTVSAELEASNFGILCVTPENIDSEWMLFEAGALSKSMLDSKVIPLLFGLELSDLGGPLSQFQALKVDMQGLMDVVKAINTVSDSKASDATINQLVPALWPKLQLKIDSIPDQEDSEPNRRPQVEVLEDLVSEVRGLAARMREFELLSSEYKYNNFKDRDFDLRMMEELMFESGAGDQSITLIMIAGALRERMPWLAEILIEGHRELKTANPEEAREIGARLMRMIKVATRGRYADRLFRKSKSGHMLMMELPHLIDRAISSKFISDETNNQERPRDIDKL